MQAAWAEPIKNKAKNCANSLQTKTLRTQFGHFLVSKPKKCLKNSDTDSRTFFGLPSNQFNGVGEQGLPVT